MRVAVVCVLALAVTGVTARAQVEEKLVEAGLYLSGELLKGIGSKLVDEALDKLWGKDVSADQRVAELQGSLAAYESGLRQVDARLADEVARLRKDLSSRTTADDVRKIVNQTLSALEQRTGKLEGRQDAIETRIVQLEKLFGYLPRVPPAPLLASISEESGKPVAHPLMAEWLNLLVRSEESRHRIDDLRRTRPETSKVLQAALADDKKLLVETQVLHAKVMKELAGKLPERQALLEEFKRGTPEVRKFDESLSSVTWLAAVTRPIATGMYAGRLAVPQALFGFDASEIVIAFDLSKADRSQVVALYQQTFLDGVARQPLRAVIDDIVTLDNAMFDVATEAGETVRKVTVLKGRMRKTKADLQAMLKEVSAQTPEVKALRSEQDACMAEIRKLHLDFDNLLQRATAIYVKALEQNRPTSERMVATLEGVLRPLATWSVMTRSQEQGIDRETWDRVSDDRSREITLKGHDHEVTTVVWSPDGKSLVTAAKDEGTVKVWNAETGRESFALESGRKSRNEIPHVSPVVAWSPDGKSLATGWGGAKVWDAGSGKLLQTFKTSSFSGVAWSPDSRFLAISSSSGESGTIWDARLGTQLFSLKRESPHVYILTTGSASLGAAWSPDGRLLATVNMWETATIWDPSTGKERFSLDGDKQMPHSRITRGVVWSPDNKRLATAAHLNPNRGGKDVAIVWDAGTGKEISFCNGPHNLSTALSWSPDGKRLASHNTVWEAESGKLILKFNYFNINSDFALKWSPDGRFVAGARSHSARVWDAGSGRLLLSMNGHSQLKLSKDGRSDAFVQDMAWSPDGRFIATASDDKSVEIWPVQELLTRATESQ